jgi:hypothetical protein
MYEYVKLLFTNLKGKSNVGDLYTVGGECCNRFFKKYGVRMWIRFIWFSIVFSGIIS